MQNVYTFFENFLKPPKRLFTYSPFLTTSFCGRKFQWIFHTQFRLRVEFHILPSRCFWRWCAVEIRNLISSFYLNKADGGCREIATRNACSWTFMHVEHVHATRMNVKRDSPRKLCKWPLLICTHSGQTVWSCI